MAVPVVNYVIEQGEDVDIALVYKTGSPGAEEAPDLTSGYSVRMDIRAANVAGDRVWTFNSNDDINDPTADLEGPQDNEAVFGTQGQITITVPRSLSLAGGNVFQKIADGVSVFAYDLFLRKPNGRQTKVLQGTITYNKSVTLWV